jgi:hypothetical protein
VNPGPKPEPKGATEEPILCKCGHDASEHSEDGCCGVVSTTKYGAKILCDCAVTATPLYRDALAALRASLVTVTADRDRLAEAVRRMTGAGEKALAGLHGKSTVNLEDTLPTAK